MFKILLILFMLFFGATFVFSLILKKMKRAFIGEVEKERKKSKYKKGKDVIYDDGHTKVLKGDSKND